MYLLSLIVRSSVDTECSRWVSRAVIQCKTYRCDGKLVINEVWIRSHGRGGVEATKTRENSLRFLMHFEGDSRTKSFSCDLIATISINRGKQTA